MCIFCDISNNSKVEEYRVVFSNKSYIALLVLYPETRGHFIVFPRKHYSESSEIKNPGELFETTLRLAEEFTKKLDAKAYVIKMNNNVFKLDNNPLHVGHIHVHVIPKYVPDAGSGKPVEENKEKLTQLKELLLN